MHLKQDICTILWSCMQAIPPVRLSSASFQLLVEAVEAPTSSSPCSATHMHKRMHSLLEGMQMQLLSQTSQLILIGTLIVATSCQNLSVLRSFTRITWSFFSPGGPWPGNPAWPL